MPGRKDYTSEELDHSKAEVKQQLAAYEKLVKSVASVTADTKVDAARAAFEPLFFNNMVLVLDRPFVHEPAWSPARTAIHSTRSKCCARP